MGGAGYSIFPEAALRYLGADLGVCGEGENKRFGPAEVREISERLAAHGIRRMGFLLLGGPGETRDSVDESLAFAHSLNLEMLKVSVGIRLYPHAPLARQAVEEGVISPEDDLLMPRFYIRPGLEDYIRQAQGEI